jgi:hypothetical protein
MQATSLVLETQPSPPTAPALRRSMLICRPTDGAGRLVLSLIALLQWAIGQPAAGSVNGADSPCADKRTNIRLAKSAGARQRPLCVVG